MSQITKSLYLLLFVLLPYFSFVAELYVLPLGLWSNIIVAILLFLLLFRGINKKDTYIFLVLTFLFFLILTVRSIFYNVNETEIAAARYPLIIIIYYYVTKWLIQKRYLKLEVLGRIIIVNSLFQAVWGLIRAIYFPDININLFILRDEALDNFIQAGGLNRETGLLLNANTYANFLLIGLFVLTYRMLFQKQTVLNYIACLLLLAGILISESRFAILIAACLLLMIFYNKISLFKLLTGTVLFIALIYIAFPYLINAFDRGYLYGVRADKNEIGLAILNKSTLNYFIGAPAEEIGATYGKDVSDTFSDNSYLSMILSFGIPLSTLYFITFFRHFFYSLKASRLSIFFLAYIIVLLFITNCIYWNYWVLYIYPVYFLLNQSAFIKKRVDI